jgi:hypothetical protein
MRTDRHDEANSRFSQFCNAPKTLMKCAVDYHVNVMVSLSHGGPVSRNISKNIHGM